MMIIIIMMMMMMMIIIIIIIDTRDMKAALRPKRQNELLMLHGVMM
jgi:hypothetical protein